MNKQNSIENSKVTVNDLIEKFYRLKVGLKATSVRTIENRVEKWIRPYFCNLYIDEVDRELLLKWFQNLKENLGSCSIRQILNVLREVLDVGVDYYGLECNVARQVKLKVQSDSKPVEVWTREEFEEFIEKVLDPHFHIFYQVLYNTGMRLGEILGLQFKDINLDSGAVRISKNLQRVGGEWIYQTAKTAKSNRTVYLSGSVLKEFKSYLESIGHYKRNDRIFYLTPYKYRSYLKMICKMYDLKPIKLHGFRHSFATELISQGVPVNYVSAWLGHSKISTTLDFYTQETERGNKVILSFLNK